MKIKNPELLWHFPPASRNVSFNFYFSLLQRIFITENLQEKIWHSLKSAYIPPSASQEYLLVYTLVLFCCFFFKLSFMLATFIDSCVIYWQREPDQFISCFSRWLEVSYGQGPVLFLFVPLHRNMQPDIYLTGDLLVLLFL